MSSEERQFRQGLVAKFSELVSRLGDLIEEVERLEAEQKARQAEILATQRKLNRLWDTAQDFEIDLPVEVNAEIIRGNFEDMSAESAVAFALAGRPRHAWTIDEITDFIEYLGVEIEEPTLRAALSRATKQGRIERVSRGKYRSRLGNEMGTMVQEIAKTTATAD